MEKTRELIADMRQWIVSAPRHESGALESLPDLWFEGQDLLQYVLRGDRSQEATIFGDLKHETDLLKTLQDALQDRGDLTDAFNEAFLGSYNPQRKTRYFTSDSGDFSVDDYIDNMHDAGCLFFEDEEPVYKPRPACTLGLDLAIPWSERHGADMTPRHSEAYSLTAEAESLASPLRVVAVLGTEIPEVHNTIHVFVTIKDFDDPIFPAIWGLLKSNLTANAAINVIMDYVIGTAHHGNGTPTDTVLADHLPDDECQVIQGKRLK